MKKKRVAWTLDELKRLEEMYPDTTLSVKEISAKLGHSVNSIYSAAKLVGIVRAPALRRGGKVSGNRTIVRDDPLRGRVTVETKKGVRITRHIAR